MEWTQLDLFGRDEDVPMELRVRIGLVADHLQWQIEAYEGEGKRLTALVSAPHRPLAKFHEELREISSRLSQMLEDLVDPF